MEELSTAIRALSDRFTVIEASVSAINDRLEEPNAGRRHVAQPEQAIEPTEPVSTEGFDFGSYSDLQAELKTVREGVAKIKLPQDLVVGDSRAGVGKNDLPRFQVIQRLLVPPPVCELQLSTDASGSGWGAVLSTPSCQLASGFWDQLLDRMFGPHTVDRFAAVGTALLPTYNSRFADPCSSGVDALGQTDWGAENNWVNPPFRLIPRVLDIIEAQRADATLIAPMWPGQPWMARLRRLCTAPPIRLPPVTRSCLPLSEQQRIEPHQNRRWTLCAWRISGAHG
ncbi:hypothetical protein FJT64_009779 [Amphibalanus amphitrite]|uniref:Uncharacterized protein n=1 Tax=Amphibalanus amphitrite TaxID=1232801 RepID=A0A6A4VGD2_AMPAM|nr:hypothetical protein FJT64_001210 [Amphibalanus amphitrite]KAF0292209.1 hypothetical protein FJT64_009779 [Amphibalanus amphitrite]